MNSTYLFGGNGGMLMEPRSGALSHLVSSDPLWARHNCNGMTALLYPPPLGHCLPGAANRPLRLR